MIAIGVTGVLGSGKTTVCRMLGSLGLEIIDADALARELTAPGTDAWARIVSAFGRGILGDDGAIDRRKLAEKVFTGCSGRLEELNGIVHPEVIKVILERMEECRKKEVPAAAVDAPLLVETGLHAEMDYVIAVRSDREKILERISAEGRAADFDARMRFQLPQEAKLAYADFILENNGELEDLRGQVEDVWGSIRKKHGLK